MTIALFGGEVSVAAAVKIFVLVAHCVGAAAAERSLALLVEEDFTIKVLTLEAGFDPDLYVRRKGVEAYKHELKDNSRGYFDYLIELALKDSK